VTASGLIAVGRNPARCCLSCAG